MGKGNAQRGVRGLLRGFDTPPPPVYPPATPEGFPSSRWLRPDRPPRRLVTTGFPASHLPGSVSATSSPTDAAPWEQPDLHPILQAAAAGELPEWCQAGPERRAHMARVADLLAGWAGAQGLPPREVARWKAAGYLHDVLRDASKESVRPWLESPYRDLPAPLVHGPAAAARLRSLGVDDDGFLTSVAFHTLGHRELDELGRALYIADFLEPGRTFRPRWRARLRARMPWDAEGVLREVLEARLVRLVQVGATIRPETVGFWNRIVGEEG